MVADLCAMLLGDVANGDAVSSDSMGRHYAPFAGCPGFLVRTSARAGYGSTDGGGARFEPHAVYLGLSFERRHPGTNGRAHFLYACGWWIDCLWNAAKPGARWLRA